MATFMAHNHIPPGGLNAPDDNMEISSDIGQRYGEDDLDIDIDLGDSLEQTNGDDEMIDDEAANDIHITSILTSAGDDEMDDEIHDDDGYMTYSLNTENAQAQDVLVDYEGDTEIVESHEYLGNTVEEHSKREDSHVDDGMLRNSAHEAIQLEMESGENAITYGDHNSQVPYDGAEIDEEEHDAIIFEEDPYVVGDTEQIVRGAATLEAGVDLVQGLDNVNNDQSDLAVAANDEPSADPSSNDVKTYVSGIVTSLGSVQGTALNDNNISADLGVEETENTDILQPLSHEAYHGLDSRSHPIVIVYEEQEINLFPTSEGNGTAQFFLANRSLVGENLQDFLGACRAVLRDHVSDDEQLEIELAQLDLTLSEDSNQASLFSLADVLDVYVQLCQNDGIDSPEPLYIALMTKSRFESRMTDLISAMRDGKGLSEIFPSTDAEVHLSENEELESNVVEAEEHQNAYVEGYATFTIDEHQGEVVRENYDTVEPAAVVDESTEHTVELESGTEAVAAVDQIDASLILSSDTQERPGNAVQVEEAIHEEETEAVNNDELKVNNNTEPTREQNHTSGDFEDELLDYSDDDEVEKQEAALDEHSSSSSTIQGESSAIDISINEVGLTVQPANDHVQLDSAEQNVAETVVDNINAELYEDEDIDYSLYEQQYSGNGIREFQDDLEESDLIGAVPTDVAHNDALDANSGATAKQDGAIVSVTVPVVNRPDADIQLASTKTDRPSTPSRKRSRFEDEDELLDTDTENDVKKARSS